MRIVDQPLPTGRRARLLEVDAHRDQQLAAHLAPSFPSLAAYSSVACRSCTLHGPTTASSRSSPLEDAVNLLTAADNDVRLLAVQRKLVEQHVGRERRNDPLDSPVADEVGRTQLGSG